MDHLQCLRTFAEVARGSSFVRAARNLALSKATVTKHVAALEASIGARLLHRSTAQVSLTEAGLRVLEAAGDMLGRYEAMESEVRELTHLPRGAISVGTPPSFGANHLVGLLAEFTDRYPDIEVTVLHDDGHADLAAEAMDLSIRIASALPDANYIAYQLMTAPQVLVASPAYLRRRGTPSTIRELARHSCLIHTLKSANGIWKFCGDQPEDVRVRGPIRSNLGDALKQATLLGAGISMHPTFTVSAEIKSGQLEVVLPQCVPPPLGINVVYATRRNMPARVLALLEFLKKWACNPPDWIRGADV